MKNRKSHIILLMFQRKFLLLLFFLFSVLTVHAQNTGIDWPEKMMSYFLQKQPEKCILLAEYVLANHSKNYTQREAKAMAFGAISCLDVDPLKASQIVSVIYQPLVDNMIIDENDFSSMTREQKKKYIKNYTDNYEAILALSELISASDSTNVEKREALFNYYHDNIFAYRNVFDSTIPEEAVNIATIIRQESLFLKLYKRYDGLLLNLYPELLSLKQNGRPSIDYAIYGAVQNFKNEIVEFGFTELGKHYLEERTNFLLQYNDLCLNINGYNAARDYNLINCQEIKQSLDSNECAVIMYSYNILSVSSINMFSGIVISPEQKQPEDLHMFMDLSSPDDFLKELESKYPNCKKFYICPIDKWEDIDVAYTNNKAYMKHSLYDLVRYPKSLKYQGGMISLFADIEYGEKGEHQETYVNPLNDGKRFIGSMKELFGDKLYSLSGKKVKKINFLNVIDDVSIFHVSTHGLKDAFPLDPSPKDTIDLYNSFVGNTSLMNFGLALSGFNEDNKTNFLSAKDVKDLLKFTGNQLVYLDACQTGETKDNFLGVNGLAKVFYFAGARNVISYNREVEEGVATDFALSFYKELKENPSLSYHDIFYRVKKRIIERYKATNNIKTDTYGRSDIGILLWE